MFSGGVVIEGVQLIEAVGARRFVLIAQPDVQRQFGRHLPIVLDEAAIVSSLHGQRGRRRYCPNIIDSQQEGSQRIACGGAGRAGIRPLRSGGGEVEHRCIGAGLECVEFDQAVFEAHLQGVPAESFGELRRPGVGIVR